LYVVSLFASAILLFVSFWVKRKHLHPLAIAFCWMTAVFLKDTVFMIVLLNLEWADVSPQLNKLFLRLANFYIITPALVVWGIDAMRGATRAAVKWLYAVIAVGLCIAVDFALVSAKAWAPVKGWSLGVSIVETGSIFLISLAATYAFQRLLWKEGIAYDTPVP